MYKMIDAADLRRRIEDHMVTAAPSPAFNFQIGWADNYENLFLGIYSSSDPNELINKALASGRVLLSARGGGAKTVILRRIAREALRSGRLATIVDLKKWGPSNDADWKELKSTTERVDYLLQIDGITGLSVAAFDAPPVDTQRVLMVDGINEVAFDIGQGIIRVLDDYVAYAINSGVIIADRLVRREVSERWKLATVLPISPQEIQSRLFDRFGDSRVYDDADAATRELWGTPYFLNAALTGEPGRTSSEVFRNYFTSHALEKHEIERASVAAFTAYREFRSRSFPLEFWAQIAGGEITGKLLSSGAILTNGSNGYFAHHLEHDYLASLVLAADTQLWYQDVFNDVTFRASSLDILSMALQKLDTHTLADLFVRRIYDWNIYAAAFAVTEGLYRESETTSLSDEMQAVILAMLAIRRWDIIEATRVKATDALSLFPASMSRRFLEARSPTDVFSIVNGINSEAAWFTEWRRLFTTVKPMDLSMRDLEQIEEPDSIIGWTYANVLKTQPLPQELQLALLRMLKRASNPTVRWRIVHVLGVFPNTTNGRALLQQLDKETDGWVKYGTIRSLIEMAALGGPSLRDHIFSVLKARAAKLVRDESFVAQLQSVIFIHTDSAPPDWARSVLGVIDAFYVAEANLNRLQMWREKAFEVRAKYAAQE